MNGVKVEDVFCIPEEQNENQGNEIDDSFTNYLSSSEERPYSLPTALSEHFTVQRVVGDGTIAGICHSCGAALKFTLRATSNLITHLKRCDPSRYEMYCQNRKCKRARRSSPVGFKSITQTSVSERGQTIDGAAELPHRSDRKRPNNTDESPVCKPIMKHFKLRQLTPQGNITALCLNCGADVKASVKASSNFITHLKRCSQVRFERYCQDRVQMRSNRCWSQRDTNLTTYTSPLPHSTSSKVTSTAAFNGTSPYSTSGSSRPTFTHTAALPNSTSSTVTSGSLTFKASHIPASISLGSPTVLNGNTLSRSHQDWPRDSQPQGLLSSDTSVANESILLKRASPGTHSADKTSCHQMFGAPQSKQRKMVKSLVLSAASDHVPYDTILNPNIREFLSEADKSFILPDLNTMNDVIVPLCAQKIQEKITSELQHVDLLYLKVTLWIDNNSVIHAIFHITFINDDWCVIDRHLANWAAQTKLIPSSFVTVVDDVTEKFKINSKVTKLLLDNNIPFADDVLDFSFVTSQCWSKNLSDCDFSTLLSFLPETVGCVTQRLRTVVVQSLWGDDTSFLPVRVAVRKSVNLMVALSESASAFEYLSRQSIDVMSVHDIRSWLSVLEVVALIAGNLTHFNAVLDFLEPPYNDSLALTGSEIEILEEITEIFNPFIRAAKCLAGDKLRAVSPLVKGLIKSLDPVNFLYLRHCETMRSRAIELARKWLGPFLTCDDVAIASFLDPRFKLNWLETQSEKDALLTKVKDHITKFNIASKNPNLTQSGVMGNCDVINAACQYYLSEPISSTETDPLLYWKCCPTTLLPLASLARGILVCTANFSTGETLDNISAWEKCYQVFSDVGLRRNLSFIDRNRELFKISM